MNFKTTLFKSPQTHSGMTVIEIIAAIALTAVVAIASVQVLIQPRQVTGVSTCELERETVQQEVLRYFHDFGAFPSRDMRELVTAGYWNRIGPQQPGVSTSPACPLTSQNLQLQNGRVRCPIHGGD